MRDTHLFGTSRPWVARRGFLLGGLAIGVVWWVWPDTEQAATLSAPDAYLAMSAGNLILIDIRRPDEWARAGIGEGAFPIDMRRKDFIAELAKLTGGNRAKPIALICAHGVRSRRMAARLTAAGFSIVVDVSEGMEGSRAGPGWVRRGLPVVAP